jgi:hypothetical protein
VPGSRAPPPAQHAHPDLAGTRTSADATCECPETPPARTGLPDSMDLVDLGQWCTVLSSLTAASNLAFGDLGTERTWCVTCIASTGPGGSR